MLVCVPCRKTVHTDFVNCSRCGEALVQSPYRWSPPRKKDDQAWKRIAKGEWLWDRRRVQRKARRVNRWYAKVKGSGKHMRFIARKEYHQKPDVDLGG